MNLLDIRPSCKAPCSDCTDHYRLLREDRLDTAAAEELLPDRATLGMVWRYLAQTPENQLQLPPICLCRKIVRWAGQALSLEQLLTCLDIFSDVGLLQKQVLHKHIVIQLTQPQAKADLSRSLTMQRLLAAKES